MAKLKNGVRLVSLFGLLCTAELVRDITAGDGKIDFLCRRVLPRHRSKIFIIIFHHLSIRLSFDLSILKVVIPLHPSRWFYIPGLKTKIKILAT
jgi:hypothetical protein